MPLKYMLHPLTQYIALNDFLMEKHFWLINDETCGISSIPPFTFVSPN